MSHVHGLREQAIETWSWVEADNYPGAWFMKARRTLRFGTLAIAAGVRDERPQGDGEGALWMAAAGGRGR
jgi:hypothetical protein